MAGGLIELVTYGAQDLYLTGTPQITFFKAVYRRYTNFAIETVVQRFNEDLIDFGNTLSCLIEKNADLIHKIYLAVDIPEVQLQLNAIQLDQTTELIEDVNFDTADQEYTTVNNFTVFNTTLYKSAISVIQPHNVNSIDTAITLITPLAASLDPTDAIKDSFKSVLLKYAQNSSEAASNYYNKVYMIEALNTIRLFAMTVTDPNTIDLVQMVNDVITIYGIPIDEEFFCRRQIALQQKLFANGLLSLDSLTRYAKFAWVKRLGHAIFDYVEVEIGGQRIDRQYSDWINIWWELTHSDFHENNYMKMIGNVCELTTFNQCKKPRYLITIPLQFWFCRYSGLALPLISLSFYDVVIRVKLRNLDECCYTDDFGIDLLQQIKLNDAYLLVDYIYLDSDERKRFAQVVHEYLIEQVQRMEFSFFSKSQNNFELEFVNPSKELVWVFQRDDFVRNTDGKNECQFYNYTLNKDTSTSTSCCCCRTTFTQCGIETCQCEEPPQFLPTVSIGNPIQSTTNFNYLNKVPSPNQFVDGNPVKESTLLLNGYEMCNFNMPSMYTNYLQPWEHSTHTPADGINIYSFAMKPEQHQPSGSCNMSRIGAVNLIVTFVPDILNNNIEGRFRVYCTNYNILRFMAGMAGIAFTVTQ
jgi:hypothetical protein